MGFLKALVSSIPTLAGAGLGALAGSVLGPAGSYQGAAFGSMMGGQFGSQIGQQMFQEKSYQQQADREDNAVFRRMQDLQRSGLSPTLAAGSAASSSAVFQSKAPDVSQAAQVATGILKQAQEIETAKSQKDYLDQQYRKADHEMGKIDAETELARVKKYREAIGAETEARDLGILKLPGYEKVRTHPGVLGQFATDMGAVGNKAAQTVDQILGYFFPKEKIDAMSNTQKQEMVRKIQLQSESVFDQQDPTKKLKGEVNK